MVFIIKGLIMSGRDSAPNSSMPSGGGSGGVDCTQLSFSTYISSPKPVVLSQVNQGTILRIEVYRQSSTETVAVYLQDTLVGGIVDNASKLLRCLNAGFTFQATVVSKNGAQIAIRVEPV